MPYIKSVKSIGESFDPAHLKKFLNNMVRGCERPNVLLKTKETRLMDIANLKSEPNLGRIEVSEEMQRIDNI